MKKRIAFVLAPLLTVGLLSPAFAQQSAGPTEKKGLAGLFSSASEDELIEPDRAFQLKVAVKGANTLVAELVPAKGYYLYKERIRFTVKDASGVAISAVKLPAGEMKNDQIFGRTEVYKKTVPAEIALNRTSKINAMTLVASYQGCHEKLGVCYPPIEKAVTLRLP
jgi:thiol:disulfide interchange protein DsbD